MAVHYPTSAQPIRIARILMTRTLGLRLGSDLHERAAEANFTIPLSRRRAGRLDCIRRSGVLFIHVPKTGGMSICQTLYGQQMKHGSARYYHHVAPHLALLPSFAVIRDPVGRFVSAYRYAINGGSADNSVAPEFRSLYRRFTSIDDALDHVETAATPYAVDHIFRPQSWYVTGTNGQIAVDDLFLFGDAALNEFVRHHNGELVPRLNKSSAPDPHITANQRYRIEKLYSRDVALAALTRMQGEHRASFGRLSTDVGK